MGIGLHLASRKAFLNIQHPASMAEQCRKYLTVNKSFALYKQKTNFHPIGFCFYNVSKLIVYHIIPLLCSCFVFNVTSHVKFVVCFYFSQTSVISTIKLD